MKSAIKFFTEHYPNDDAKELAKLLRDPQEEGTRDWELKQQYSQEFMTWYFQQESEAD